MTARLARVLSIGTPFHVTQRGNARQVVFESDADHWVYLELLKTGCHLDQLSLIGYCLLSNHVHLVTIPQRADSLPRTLKHTHGRYAAYLNARRSASGHVWQGPAWLEMEPFHDRWSAVQWRGYLGGAEPPEQLAAIRRNTHTGGPLGAADFVTGLERTLRRRLSPAKGGRPSKEKADQRQA